MTAFALVFALVSGCGKKPEVYPAEGNAYMKDPAFRAALKVQERERDVLTGERLRTQEALKKLLDKYGSAAAVTNTAEGAELYAKLVAGEAAFASNRMATAALIRERAKRAAADSQLIKAGKAKPVKDLKK